MLHQWVRASGVALHALSPPAERTCDGRPNAEGDALEHDLQSEGVGEFLETEQLDECDGAKRHPATCGERGQGYYMETRHPATCMRDRVKAFSFGDAFSVHAECGIGSPLRPV